MIEKPDVSDEVILRAIERCYAVRARGLTFIPHGLDTQAWAYRVDAAGGPFFLKVNLGSAPAVGAWLPAFLAQQGLPNVITPLEAVDGAYVAESDGLCLRLQAFVAGRRGVEGGLPARVWEQFGAFLCRLHALDVPPDLESMLRRETFESPRWQRVAELSRLAEQDAAQDPIVADLFAFWRHESDTVAAVLARTEALRRRVQQTEHHMVLCHADAHTANLLVTADGRMYIVDWDDAMLAPRERDLMFVLADAGPQDWAGFTRGYGDVEIDALALAYYQHAWCVEDIGAFAEEILDVQGAGTASRENSLSWFKSLFEDGSSVATALLARIGALA